MEKKRKFEMPLSGKVVRELEKTNLKLKDLKLLTDKEEKKINKF